METFCETVQFYLRHLEDSVYPVMTEDQFAVKLFPMHKFSEINDYSTFMNDF